MRNKFLAARNVFSFIITVLLALCTLVTLCFSPWTAFAVDGDDVSVEEGEPVIGVPVPEGVTPWSGDLVKAGWGTADGEKPATYVEEGDTVKIGDAEALAYFSHEVNSNNFEGKTVILESDIDLANKLWIPIGFASRSSANQSDDPMFSGTFDGNGKTIYNLSASEFVQNIYYDVANGECAVTVGEEPDILKITVPTRDDKEKPEHEYPYGLFGVTGNAVIKNLSVVNVNLSLGILEYGAADGKTHLLIPDCVGSIVGYAAGNITMENCTAGCAENSKDKVGGNTDNCTDMIDGVACAGGLVGRAYAGLYNGKPYGRNDSEVTNSIVNAGHTFGEIRIKNCVNYVTVGNSGDGDKKGGIVAYVYCNSVHKFENCVNYGDIYGTDAGGITSYWQMNAGNSYSDGGAVNHDWEFINCVNYGNVTGKTNVGGIFGRNTDGGTLATRTIYFAVTGCKNYGAITNLAEAGINDATGATGGIAGYVSARGGNYSNCVLKDNFNYGEIAGVAENLSNGVAAGGIFGYLSIGTGTVTGVSGGNCGKITGYGAHGCIGKSAGGTYTEDYLINAYYVEQGA